MSLRSTVGSWLAKISGATPVVMMMFRGQKSGIWTKRNYAQYSDDAYKRNVVAFKAISTVARSAAHIPLEIELSEDRYAEKGHPMFDLLMRPNPWQSGKTFIESVVAYYMLTGNTYIEGVGPDSEAAPRELYSLRPDRMRVVPGEMGVDGYVYVCNGQEKRWKANPIDGTSEILHIRTWNPLDDFYGMSPIEAAAYAIDAHNMAGEWNQALLQNAARPSGAMVYKSENGATLTDKQFERIKEQINSAYSGSKNAGRPIILEGGLEWQQMSMTPAEMDWINGKNVSAREIALSLGCPPQILGIPGDNTYSNYQEARLSLYEDTVIPTLSVILDQMNHWLSPVLGDARIEMCLDDLPALAVKREKRWEMVQNADWLTVNEKREATGYDPLDIPDADEVFIKSGQIPLTGAATPPSVDEPVLDENGDPVLDENGLPVTKPADPNLPPGGKPGKPKLPKEDGEDAEDGAFKKSLSILRIAMETK